MTHDGDDGFTLVEMLVVLAIMAVMFTISMPYVRGSGDARILDASAQTLAARLRDTQSSAVFNNAERILKFDLKNIAVVDPLYKFPAGTTLQIETAENQINQDTASFRFFADGGSTGGKIILIKGNIERELDINWLTGAVLIVPVSSP
jgi:general secretion pathway protein H